MKQRDYKFRAWDDKEKKWLLGYEMPNLGGFSLFGETVLLNEWSSILDQYAFDRNGHKFDDLKVMQYTGMKDKNGKEIYEGDIVKVFYTGKSFRVIKWSEGNHNIGFNLGSSKDQMFEVIGNVWENPELVK